MKHKIFKSFALLCALLLGTGIGWAADPVTGSSTENMAGQGFAFTNGYDYSFSTSGTDVTISFTEKESYTGLVAYLWNYTSGFAETQMTVTDHTASIVLTGQTAGTKLTFACKFAFAGGMSVTKQFEYTVPGGGGGPTVTAPTTAAPVPTIAANRVKSIYSDSYTFAPASLNSYNEGWWDAPTMAEEAIGGNHMLHYSGKMTGMIGWQYASTNMAQMEKLHVDIWVPTTGTILFGPISETVAAATKTINVTGGQWNSFDFDLATDFPTLVLAKMFQHEFMNYSAQTDLYVDNYFFYRTTDPGADTEKPTAFTASLASASYTSVNITAQATDNSGSVIFKVYDGTTEIASKTGVSAESTTVTVTGLTAGTAYNLTVKAQDETGNVNDSPVAINATTKSLPAPAAAPTKEAANVISIYSDAYTSAASGWYVGGWGQTTVMEKMNLAEGDEAVVCSNANYLGWELGATLDCSSMNYVHFDMYVAAAGSVQFTPIWGGEQLVTCNLAAGWNSIDLPLSTYTNINKANIYQLKWAVMPSECWIDNVYFYYEIPTKDIVDYNYALASNGATASASSTAGDVFLAAFANDGNIGTRWASAENDAEWWMVDMQAYCKFNTIQIVWEGAYTASFTVEASSNGTDWSTIASVTDQKLEGFPYTQTIEVTETTARYIRFNATKRATQWSNSFWEFRAYKAGASVLTTFSAAIANPIMKVGEENAITITALDQNNKPMDPGTVTYEITPSDAGTITNNVFTAVKKGAVSIVAKAGAKTATAISTIVVKGANLAFSSNIVTDNKVIAESEVTGNATSGFYAVDGNKGSVWQACRDLEANKTSAAFTSYFTVDLQAKYNLDLIAIWFDGAASDEYTIEFSSDNETWKTGYSISQTIGNYTHTKYIMAADMQNNTDVRFVRYTTTKASTTNGWGMKMFEFEVYGEQGSAPAPTESPYCDTEVGHLFLETPDVNSYILLSIGADGKGNTIVNIKQDAAKNNVKFDYLQVTGKAAVGEDVATGGLTEMGVSFVTPAPDGDGNITLEILWSTVGFAGRWMVQNVKVPATATCASAVIPLPVKDIADYNYALSSNGGTAWATSGTAANAIDGNTGTRWESASADPQTFVVDLHAYCTFNTVQILWEGAYGKSFTIDVSNDSTTWTTVATIADQTLAGFPYLQTIELAKDTSARFVRFNGTARGTGYGYSFYEFRVFKPAAPVLTKFSAAIANPIMKVGDENAITITALDQNDKPMDPGTVTYEITPSDAGSVTNNVFTAAKKGAVSIVAKADTKTANAVSTFVYENDNVALGKVADGTGYNNIANLTDGNVGSDWQGARNGAPQDTTVSFVLDLGAKYNIELVAIRFEGACSDNYDIDFSSDNSTWTTAYASCAAVAMKTDWYFHNSNVTDNKQVRYVRFFSRHLATGYGMRIFEFQVHGTEVTDTEKPVMTSATLNSKTHNSAIINVAATDNEGVVSYPVYNGEALMGDYTANSGQITMTDLTPETAYTLDVKAKDAAGNVSDNSVQVVFTTDPTPAVENPYCDKEIGHLGAENADPNSFIILSIGADGKGNTIVHIGQDLAKNTQKFDYLQVTGSASTGADVETGGVPEMGVSFATPQADGDGNITLEILWSTVNWGGRWMVQNVKVPATATCATAVLPLPYKDEYDMNYALSSNGGTAWATSGTAANAIDGNTGTRWESLATDPQTFVVDLHAHCTFNTVQMIWEGAYGKSFTIDASNDSITWNTIATVTDQTLEGFPYEQTIDVDETSARYVRFNGTARGTGYGYSFWEFRVFKAGVQVLTTFQVTPAQAICKIGVEDVLTIVAKDQNGVAMNPGEITYVVSPATAGAVVEGKYTPAEKGMATITATAGDKESQFTVFGVLSDNLALSTNIVSDNKITAQSEIPEGGTDAYHAIDADDGSTWYTPHPGTTTYDAWFVVDLGAQYNIELVDVHFEGACSADYDIDFSADNTNWTTAYADCAAVGMQNKWYYHYSNNTDNKGVRYVRFFSKEAATGYGLKVFSFQVFGEEYVPIFEPVRSGQTPGALGTICLPYDVAVADRQGATFYKLDYTDGSQIYFIEETGKLEAGHAYIFQAEATEISMVKGDTAAWEPETDPDVTRGLYGTFVNITPGNLTGKYVIATDYLIHVCGTGAYLNANRAYIDLEDVPTQPLTSGVAARRLVFGGVPHTTPTNLDEQSTISNQQSKMIIDGQLIIIRDGKKFNAQGLKL